ncbi:hypothetical protein [Enterococcus sp. AZ103]|uniref:hypothetical protein n=1 Tax=Enterococcus sp. AZ103 TaxID=2774628 RepID=UPI003F27BA69
MENSSEFQFEKVDPASFIKRDLLYNAAQLNEQLAKELSLLQEERHSRITTRVINLAMATATITKLAELNQSDSNTVIQNRMGH